jgi:lysophospholipase L1-like esterase
MHIRKNPLTQRCKGTKKQSFDVSFASLPLCIFAGKGNLLVSALLVLLSACSTATPTMTPTPTPLRILALGDSYTIGESVAAAERFPVQLVARLRERVTVDDPEIIARTGWTTDELAAAIAQADPQGPYDYVTLLIGVNNQYRGYPLETYRDEFRQLLQQAITFAGGNAQRVIVLSIPDWGVTPFAWGANTTRIATEIDAFNAANRAETDAAGAIYVDITPISRQAASQPELVATDGLHPSGKMYAAWVKLLLDNVDF